MILRIILLKRFSQLQSGCFEDYEGVEMLPDIRGPWIVLGHFDAMFTWRPPMQRGFFETIRRCSEEIAKLNSGSAYYHPLYLIDENGEDCTEEQKFWDPSDWFCAVIRIHLSDLIYDEQQMNTLTQNMKKEADAAGCEIRTYRTMELSDIVVAVRSNQIKPMLNFSLSLQRHASVGKEYTYVGLSYLRLCSGEKPVQSDCIPLLSMRFSVSNYGKAQQALRQMNALLKMRPKTYAVTGVDDIAIFWRNFPVNKLVTLYRDWFLPEIPQPHTELQEAFWEITSRVGIATDTIREEPPPKEPSSDSGNNDSKGYLPEEILRAACEALSTQGYSQLKDKALIQDDACWYRPLGELIKSLERICKTPVLDEFVFLLFPGAKTFLDNLVARADRSTSEKETEQYNLYVEMWSHLMEHVMRLEGQMSQYPDTRPILYNIPVVMLEYMMAFANQITQILKHPKIATHSFFLAPQLGNQVKSHEVFEANSVRRGLVLVTLPLQTLYQPAVVQMALCHEICHFVGDQYRKRSERIEAIANSTAVLTAKILFGTYHESLIDELFRNIRRILSEKNEPYIREMYIAVQKWVNSLFKGEKKYNGQSKAYSELLYATLEDIQEHNREPLRLEYGINDGVLYRYFRVLGDVFRLYREIYADVCMMFLLDGSPQTYIYSISEVIKEDGTLDELVPSRKGRAENSKEESRQYSEYFAIRIYVTLYVLNKLEYIGRGKLKVAFQNDALVDELVKLKEEMKRTSEPQDRVIPVGSILPLMDYADLCYKYLKDTLCDHPALTALRGQLKNISAEDLDYGALLQEIQRDRKNVIEDLAAERRCTVRYRWENAGEQHAAPEPPAGT